MSRKLRNSLAIEGLETRAMMAIDLPRLVAPQAAHRLPIQVAPPARPVIQVAANHNGNTPGGGDPTRPIPTPPSTGDISLLRGLHTAAAEMALIDQTVHRLLQHVADPAQDGVSAQLDRLKAAATHIGELVAGLLPAATGATAAASNAAGDVANPTDPNVPPGMPPTGELLVRGLTSLADRLERVDRRLTDQLASVDATKLSPQAKDVLARIGRTAQHIVSDVTAPPPGDDGGDDDGDHHVPTPAERRLTAVVAQLKVTKTVLDRSLERLGEPGGELPPMVARFLGSISTKSAGIVEQIDAALPDEGEGDPAAAAAAANTDHAPRPPVALAGLVVVNASVTRADAEVKRILASLPDDGLTPEVQQLLAEISACAATIGEKVAPYLPAETPEENA